MKRIRIDQIGGYSERLVNELIAETVLTIDRKIKMKNPVGESRAGYVGGRMRYSWQVGENDQSGGVAETWSSSGFPKVDKLNYQKEKVGNVYSIHNNLPYAEPVAQGTNLPPSWGGQYRSRAGLSPGWLNLIAKEESNRLKRNWNKIVREN